MKVDVFDITQVVPHVYATIWATLILIGISIFIYFYYKKNDARKKPSGFRATIEGGFEGFQNTMEESAGPRLKKAYPYFFTLFLFLLVSTTMELLGFVNPAGSIAFTLTLGLITFIGIFVIGIFTQGLITFIKHKYVNPTELIGQFSPLISISLRLFGATFAGSLLGQVLLIVLNIFVTAAPAAAAIPFINIAYQWIMFFITIAFGMLQSYIFVMLTMIYWNQELGHKAQLKKDKKEKKKQQKQNKKQKSELLIQSQNEMNNENKNLETTK